MGMTITEKIIARAAGLAQVKPGEFVTVRPDLVIMSDRTAFSSIKDLEELGIDEIERPDRTMIVIDHTVQGANTAAPVVEGNRRVREFARRQSIPHFYDVGRGGLRHQVAVERGYTRPGMLCMTDEPDLDNIGVLGALDYADKKNVYVAMAMGEIEMQVPESLQFVVHGTCGPGVTSWDLGQRVRHDLRNYGDIGKVKDYTVIRKIAEFVGPGIEAMSIDGRMNLLAMYPIGRGIMNPDDRALAWVRERTQEPFEVITSDTSAQYEKVFEYDLTALGPQVSAPPTKHNTAGVSSVEGLEIHQAVVGSCCNGRLEDLQAVASILDDRQVHPNVKMFITPISQEVYTCALQEGLIQTFVEAGAVVLTPSCSTCWGYMGQLAAGEVCISTTQHNYPGRMGSREAKIYLANPLTVAASAVEGRVTDPRKFLD